MPGNPLFKGDFDESHRHVCGALYGTQFTRDDDLLAEAVSRQRNNRRFHGVVHAHQLHVSIGRCIKDLQIISEAATSDDVIGEVLFLPL